MQNTNERQHWIALSHFPQVGARRFQYLWDTLGSIAAVWQASPVELAAVRGFTSAQAQTLFDFCRRTDPEKVSHEVEKAEIGVITRLEPEYPALLTSLYDPPPVLYWLGQAEIFQRMQRSVALVGTRDATAYGRQVAYQLGRELAQAGVMVVSGMAYGIDSAAHRGALSAGSGHTLAVLGSGVDVITPPRNHALYSQLKAEGLLLSEFPPGFPAASWSPLRLFKPY